MPFGAVNADVVAGQRAAALLETKPIDWRHTALTLFGLSQVDNRRDGNDPSRCGAAAITAGLILRGPEEARVGLANLQARATEVLQRLPQTPRLGPAEGQRQSLVMSASQTIEGLRRRDPSTWTYGDASRLQQAIFDLSIVDAHTPPSGRTRSWDRSAPGESLAFLPIDPGMQAEMVREYRDLAWNGATPEFELASGRRVPVDITIREGGSAAPGHFVLTEGRAGREDGGVRQIIYDSWPEASRGGAPYTPLIGGTRSVTESATVQSGGFQDIDRRR